MNQKTSQKNQADNWDADSLPKLTDHDTNVALSHENRAWAMNFSKLENIGKIHFMEGMGFTIQNYLLAFCKCFIVLLQYYCTLQRYCSMIL